MPSTPGRIMTDYAAQLLNELMGRNRDLLPDQQAVKLSYDSPEVSDGSYVFSFSICV